MKDFFKFTLASVTGVIIVFVIVLFIGVVSLAGMVASEQAMTQVKENSVFTLRLNGMLSERSEENIFTSLSGGETSIGLNDILSSIDKAEENENIKGIYIVADAFVSDSPASSHAIRARLEKFKKSGKWIIAYADTYTQTAYYICSVADKVYLNPIGMLDWHGLSAQPMYYKDLMAKFGVKVQLFKVGKYKSLPETYTADNMSDANREQVTTYMNNIWSEMVADVAKSRKLSAETLNMYADEYLLFTDAKQLQIKGMIDGLMYADDVKAELRKKLGIGDDDDINSLSLSKMKNVPYKETAKGDEIAIYYAYGSIVQTNKEGIASSGSLIVGEDVCADLQKLADDDDVKAVVIRVNSGGGSAYASEQMWHAITKLKEKKPVVMSMGGMAASGGYYMSCPASYIFAENTTITGSIGIFGMLPDFSGLLTEKLGIKFDEVNTNKNSGLGTLSRPFNEDERALMEAYIDRGYELFRKRVAEGRKMKVEDVEAIAQGRVWTGGDALKIKLVDAIGNIDDAIEKAAKLAKLDEYHTSPYPAMPSMMEQLMSSLGGDDYLDSKLRETLGEYYAPFAYIKTIDKQDVVQARLPYELVIR